MSIVEKAISKLQQAAPPRPVERAFPAASASAVPHSKAVPLAEAPPLLSGNVITVNHTALLLEGLLPPKHQERQIAQQYRRIKRPLIAGAQGRGASPGVKRRVIMVASAMSGEGKTFTSINLALSMAREKDVRVLLVDADLPKPHISRLLGVDQEAGLIDALLDPAADVEEFVCGTDIPNLYILPCGKRSENSTELLASERMRNAMVRLLERDPQRIVLLDSPPLLMTTESEALTQVADEIVVVVRAGATPQQSVLEALSHVGKDKSIGLVLNQSLHSTSGQSYYDYEDAERSSSA